MANQSRKRPLETIPGVLASSGNGLCGDQCRRQLFGDPPFYALQSRSCNNILGLSLLDGCSNSSPPIAAMASLQLDQKKSSSSPHRRYSNCTELFEGYGSTLCGRRFIEVLESTLCRLPPGRSCLHPLNALTDTYYGPQTILQRAVVNGDTVVVEDLLSKGAHPNVSCHGTRALDMISWSRTCKSDRTFLYQSLVRRGALPTCRHQLESRWVQWHDTFQSLQDIITFHISYHDLLLKNNRFNTVLHERYDESPVKVLPWVYLGSENHRSVHKLREFGINTVVDLATSESKICPPATPIQYVPISGLRDDSSTDILVKSVKAVFSALDKARTEGRVCLVHCKQGLNRSGVLVIAYIAKTLGISLLRSAAIVAARRPGVLHNRSFQRQAILFASYNNLLTSTPTSRIDRTLSEGPGHAEGLGTPFSLEGLCDSPLCGQCTRRKPAKISSTFPRPKSEYPVLRRSNTASAPPEVQCSRCMTEGSSCFTHMDHCSEADELLTGGDLLGSNSPNSDKSDCSDGYFLPDESADSASPAAQIRVPRPTAVPYCPGTPIQHGFFGAALLNPCKGLSYASPGDTQMGSLPSRPPGAFSIPSHVSSTMHPFGKSSNQPDVAVPSVLPPRVSSSIDPMFVTSFEASQSADTDSSMFPEPNDMRTPHRSFSAMCRPTPCPMLLSPQSPCTHTSYEHELAAANSSVVRPAVLPVPIAFSKATEHREPLQMLNSSTANGINLAQNVTQPFTAVSF